MSKKPNKERKKLHTAAKHEQTKMVSANLSEVLSKELKKRSLPLKKGDSVKIMRGEFRGKEGKVLSFDRPKRKVFVEKVLRKKGSGEEWLVPIDTSKVMIMDLERSDSKRFGSKAKEVKK